jgi:MFS transporter, DHA1 family, multidrug resistance protein
MGEVTFLVKHDSQGKVAIFLVLFFMSLSLHIQFPIFTPYAVALGATTIFISVMMSSSSFTNLVGNVMAGPFIDRIGKKPFIVVPLFLSSVLMTAHALATNPHQLLYLRITNGFVLAFMSPACFSLLSAYAKNSRQQGKNMAINGVMITLANIIAPFIGGHLVEFLNYRGTYYFIGLCLLLTAIVALLYVKEADPIVVHRKEKTTLTAVLSNRSLLPIYFIGFALMYGHGTLIFELPFLTVEQGLKVSETGTLFSMMGIGTLLALSFFWLNRFSPLIRTAVGMFSTSLLYYQLTTSFLPIRLSVVLFCMGIAFGLIFPALTTLLTEKVGLHQYGSAFGVLSAVFSLAMILSTLTSGIVRSMMSPYYLAFLVTMLGAVFIVFDYIRDKRKVLA